MYLRACPLKLELGRPIQLAAQESKSHLAELVGSTKDGDKRRTVAHEEQWLGGRRGTGESYELGIERRGDRVCDMIMVLIFLF